MKIRKKGKVIGDKQNKTIVVEVDRRIQDPLYKKFIVKKKKFYVHDERNEASTGDIVEIISSRPLSKLKRWRLDKIIKKKDNP